MQLARQLPAMRALEAHIFNKVLSTLFGSTIVKDSRNLVHLGRSVEKFLKTRRLLPKFCIRVHRVIRCKHPLVVGTACARLASKGIPLATSWLWIL
eukprot:COSAG05_NODE_1849_length_3965_cov_10.605018_1_plen_95_part_10